MYITGESENLVIQRRQRKNTYMRQRDLLTTYFFHQLKQTSERPSPCRETTPSTRRTLPSAVVLDVPTADVTLMQIALDAVVSKPILDGNSKDASIDTRNVTSISTCSSTLKQ